MSIQAEISLKTSPFLKGVQEVKAATERMMKDTAAAAAKHGGHSGGESFLRGERSVERNSSRLVSDILRAHSSSEMLGASLERVGKIFRLGIATAVGAHIAGQMIEAREKFNEETDAMIEKAGQFSEAAKDKLNFGSVMDKIGVHDQATKQFSDLGDQLQKLTSFSIVDIGANFDAVFHGDAFAERVGKLAAARSEMQATQAEARNAAIEDYEQQVKIANLRIDGSGKEADEAERLLKLSREILRIKQSSLDSYAKSVAIDSATQLSESAEKVAEANAERAQETNRIATAEKEITAERAKQENMGETNDQKRIRLVRELLDLEKTYQAEVARRGADGVRAKELRAEMAKRSTEVWQGNVKVAGAFNANEEKNAKGREDSKLDIMLNAEKMVAGISGDQYKIDAAANRESYYHKYKARKGQGYSEEMARGLANQETRLEYMKAQAEKNRAHTWQNPGDSDRRRGMGGYIDRNIEAGNSHAARGNAYLAKIATAVQQANVIFGKIKGIVIGPATFT